MRGKVAAPVAEGVKRGITPAYAGKRGVFCPRTLP